jgi:hypothetical protein
MKLIPPSSNVPHPLLSAYQHISMSPACHSRNLHTATPDTGAAAHPPRTLPCVFGAGTSVKDHPYRPPNIRLTEDRLVPPEHMKASPVHARAGPKFVAPDKSQCLPPPGGHSSIGHWQPGDCCRSSQITLRRRLRKPGRLHHLRRYVDI